MRKRRLSQHNDRIAVANPAGVDADNDFSGFGLRDGAFFKNKGEFAL